MKKMGFVLLIVLLSFALVGCKDEIIVEGIAIDEDSVENRYEIDDFSLDEIKIIVSYDDKTTKTMSVTEDMISNSDLELLTEIGLYSIDVFYGGHRTILEIEIFDSALNVIGIEIDETTVLDTYEVSSTEVFNIVLNINTNDVTMFTKITEEMMSVEDYQKLSTVGSHSIVITYADFSTTLNILITDDFIDIGVVLPDASEERWANQDGAYFEAELEALGEGYKYEILFSEGDEAKEVQNVEALIAKGAEVIILTTEGYGAGAVQAAHDAGVILIAHDRMAKSADDNADYYTTFNSWNVGKAMGAHLAEEAANEGCTAAAPCDLAIFAGRVADWPNATYFFGGAMEELQPVLDIFTIINVEDTFSDLDLYTENTFDNAAKTALQAAMLPVDTDWNGETAGTKAAAVVAQLGSADKSSQPVFVLAPNDDTSTAIRQEFAKMANPYESYYTTGQDAANITIASLMGDPVKGKGTQTMTVFKDLSKLCADSVAIAKNIIDGVAGLNGLTTGPSIDGAGTAYAPIDTLTFDDPQFTYDLIFATGYKDEEDSTFSNIDFTPYK